MSEDDIRDVNIALGIQRDNPDTAFEIVRHRFGNLWLKEKDPKMVSIPEKELEEVIKSLKTCANAYFSKHMTETSSMLLSAALMLQGYKE